MCNLQCRYCFQKGILEPGTYVAADINESVLSMLYEIIEQTDEHKFTVRFTGGEPLMYMDKMRRIVEQLKPLSDRIHYLTVTNGTLLTQEIVNFFNDHCFEVGISNDGEHTIKTRGVNVLEDEHLTRLICGIDNMHFVCVYSAINADYKANIDYYKAKIGGRRHNVQAAMGLSH